MRFANISTEYDTPWFAQYIYDLPPNDDDKNEKLTILDYIIIIFAGLALLYGVYYILMKMLVRKPRRRVSFEGEKLAERTIENFLGNGIDEFHEDRAYFK